MIASSWIAAAIAAGALWRSADVASTWVWWPSIFTLVPDRKCRDERGNLRQERRRQASRRELRLQFGGFVGHRGGRSHERIVAVAVWQDECLRDAWVCCHAAANVRSRADSFR